VDNNAANVREEVVMVLLFLGAVLILRNGKTIKPPIAAYFVT